MAIAAIHVVPDKGFDDWIVRDDSGYELGHRPTRESAESVCQAIAKASGPVRRLSPAGQTSRTNFI
jgi:hypothetical protein